MKHLTMLLCCCLALGLNAQQRVTFSSQNYAGLLEGEHGSAFQLQTINGVRYGSWFAGVGTGIDWYYRRSVPAFISVGKQIFTNSTGQFFISADGGINFPWRDKSGSKQGWYEIEKSSPGAYWTAGFGYKLSLDKKGNSLLINLGYSYKHSSETTRSYFIIYDPPAQYSREELNYYLRRLSIKFGWTF